MVGALWAIQGVPEQFDDLCHTFSWAKSAVTSCCFAVCDGTCISTSHNTSPLTVGPNCYSRICDPFGIIYRKRHPHSCWWCSQENLSLLFTVRIMDPLTNTQLQDTMCTSPPAYTITSALIFRLTLPSTSTQHQYRHSPLLWDHAQCIDENTRKPPSPWLVCQG